MSGLSFGRTILISLRRASPIMGVLFGSGILEKYLSS
jgi:hypothetical protein